jgi:hypothetical protein
MQDMSDLLGREREKEQGRERERLEERARDDHRERERAQELKEQVRKLEKDE